MKFISFFALLTLELASVRASTRHIRSSCARPCPLLYSPICGYDPETKEYQKFSNKCFLGAENDCNKKNFIVKYAGPCKETSSECKIICTDDMNPVCALNVYENIYRTFPNSCSVKMENECSKNKDRYTISYPGECKECFACKCASDKQVCAFDYTTESYQTFPCNCTLEKENICPTSNTPRDNFEYRYDGECKCSIQCTQKSDPVCAKSSVYGYYQTFNSKCSLEAEMKCNPNDAGFVYKYDGFCKCPQFCTLDYRPVCAINNTDGKEVTFGNQCEMDAANKCPEEEIETHDRIRYSFLRMGECVPQNGCYKACTREYNPICGCDSYGQCETFSNHCLLEEKNECGPADYKMIKEGECNETNTVPVDLIDHNTGAENKPPTPDEHRRYHK